ncbi:MAG: RpiB/LacA/LacB family sugar-phosphate isomerase [Bilifractor sp.]
MKVALVMEYSTSDKNEKVAEVIRKVADKYDVQFTNYGQFGKDDGHQTYNQNAIFTAALLNSGVADFVVTGCGTGMGAMLATNAMPGVICEYAWDQMTMYLDSQINGGNAVSMPFAYHWGWAAELNLENMMETIFTTKPGGGYPPANAASEQQNAKLLNKMKAASCKSFVEFLQSEDPDVKNMIRGAFAGKRLEMFRAGNPSAEVLDAVEKALQ